MIELHTPAQVRDMDAAAFARTHAASQSGRTTPTEIRPRLGAVASRSWESSLTIRASASSRPTSRRSWCVNRPPLIPIFR